MITPVFARSSTRRSPPDEKDTIERAVERGAGGGDDDNYEELTYEGYGPGGVAIFVEVMTDNKNRSVAEIRHAFNKMGGNLGPTDR